MVMVGGELTLESLELSYSPTTGFYMAPVQAVANGGVLVIDDFGRQHVLAPRPAESVDRARSRAGSTSSRCRPDRNSSSRS